MIVVIGGSGFVGTRLCRRFAQTGRDFVILDKNPSTAFPDRCVNVDVRDLETLRSAIPKGGIIINLAAEHRDDVRPLSLYEDVNVGGAVNICQVSAEKNVKKIVFTSTVACYGFAPPRTGEEGAIKPFNEYGKTKARAEEVYRSWYEGKDEGQKTLTIIRPTVIFGEGNRGNVYNLLRQIASGRFVMVGDGRNVKSMAYVENVVAFIEYALEFESGAYVYNYVDKPDFNMNDLVALARLKLNRSGGVGPRLPYVIGLAIGGLSDALARLVGKKFPISTIRVKKFCATTQFSSSVEASGFLPPTTLAAGFEKTISYEFLENNETEEVFFTE
ncbi:NAD-dependent epimerase/dehydratase family protein [Dyella flava]|uniref:NAD-dependent epimerase/dehydratase family protein n=1 Tax=Dyella flava TaxID=1920170 RepID=A0ABS2JYP3_9GAMM|nr:NAD-dependent epimerase/dehydratase family protein [Dyella flava]MBM7123984.1 NAD-dependent epimerase/dehydratase family protein [Dyella flava]GLQ50570.1 epimerase [Dyella flava]